MADTILPDSPPPKTTSIDPQHEPTSPAEVELCHKCGLRPVAPARAKVRHRICGPCFEQLPSNRRYRHSSKWRDARRRFERSASGKMSMSQI